MKTQARKTKKLLNIAANYYINGKRDLGKQALLSIIVVGIELVNELARYEASFTYKKLKKYVKDRTIQELTENQVQAAIQAAKVKVNKDRDAETIINTYEQFIRNKIAQYEKISDETPEEDLPRVIKDKTNGLFTWQNLAIAGVIIIGIANFIRERTAQVNDLYVEWVAILDKSTCDFCRRVDGSVHKAPTKYHIPAHSNCRCTWIILDAQQQIS